MKRFIIVRFTFEGLHHWPGAPHGTPEWYLKNVHRHVFHVEAKKEVFHGDRDIEFIAYKREMETFCKTAFGGRATTLSCEHMAEQLVNSFLLHSCRVFEDGENGAEIVRE